MATADFWRAAITRGTSESDLDAWNRSLRGSDVYQNFMRTRGLSTDGRVKLSREQQGALERELAKAGFAIPGGMHIDQGGNLNQKNNLVRNVGIGAGVTAAALATAGAAGAGPLAGAFGGSGAAAGGAGATVNGLSLTPYAGTAAMSAPGVAAGGSAMASGIPWLRLAEIGAPIATSLYGGRQATKANDKAMAFELDAMQRSEALARENEARRRQEWDTVQAQTQRAWEADQEQQRLDRDFVRQQWNAGANRRALRDAALISLGGVGRSTSMPVVDYSAPSAPVSATPVRQSGSAARGSDRYITPPGQYDYRPRLIPLAQVGY